MIDVIYNGKYLQHEVQGLKILQVTGREVTGYEIDEKQIGGLDGSTYLSSSIEPRDIKVKFTLAAPTKEAYRIRMNKLNNLLRAREVQLRFSDENDKYFNASSAEASRDEIIFHCCDPFKYSVAERLFTMANDTINITNTGSVPVPIRYEITHNHENGYVGIASEHGAMEFGKREEADGKTYTQNECLLSLNNFISAPDDKTSIDGMHPLYGTKGSLKTMTYNGRTYLTLNNSGTLVGNANGGMRTVTIPADSAGKSGALNWDIYMHLIMWANAMGQTGEFSVSILTADNKLIAGLNWGKTDMSGNTAFYDFVIYNPSGTNNDPMKGRILKEFTFQTDHRHELNPFYGDWGHCMMRKEGAKFTFFYWGQYHTFNVPEAANLTAAKIQISCKAWKASNKRLYIYGFDTFDFYKLGVTKWRDVPNRYWQGSKLEIDGNTGQFLVAGMPKPQDEILGTKWFKAEPGETEVKLYFSSFCSPKPTVVARIREAWL